MPSVSGKDLHTLGIGLMCCNCRPHNSRPPDLFLPRDTATAASPSPACDAPRVPGTPLQRMRQLLCPTVLPSTLPPPHLMHRCSPLLPPQSVAPGLVCGWRTSLSSRQRSGPAISVWHGCDPACGVMCWGRLNALGLPYAAVQLPASGPRRQGHGASNCIWQSQHRRQKSPAATGSS